ncbi:hypothetical protein P4O66_016742 [Electrophorus voltai]|uniref:Ig-like domain-containing protein n=1 Tax=Electrophorus voltai TaxID=2609070 RepID=A0AAD8YYR1_9TELE|nr:hypothetical protein P4O66_016742 [Electrophorus voltai]
MELPQCSANSSSNNEYLILSCSWEGGFPRTLLWWVSSSGDMQGTSEENSNTQVLRSSATYSGKTFVCHAKHPLAKESKQCVLKLETPVLMTQLSMVSVFEGNDVQLSCMLGKTNPPATEITWYNNLRQNVGYITKKYILQQAGAWSNLTVRETDSKVDNGFYFCSTINAIGRADLAVLLLVIRYPLTPNVTISKIIYNNRQRTDVNMEWLIKADAKPPFRAYPAVIRAAIGGMLVATIPTVLLFLYVVRNRNNIPRDCPHATLKYK